MKTKNNFKKGFTLIEMVLAIGITAVIVTLTVSSFTELSNFQSIDKDSDVVLSYLEKARTQTINSKNFSEYGVRFATTSITLFPGTAYTSTSSNIVYNLSTKVKISSISLSGGVTDVYFNKVTGESSATGTITFQLQTASTTKKIIIYGTGLSEIQ